MSANTELLNQEADLAADFIEELLNIADLEGDIEMGVKDERAIVHIVSDNKEELDQLIGEDGEVLTALQELARMAVSGQVGERANLLLDINSYRADILKKLEQIAQEAVDKLSDQEEVELDSMNSFERKNIHDKVAALGAFSFSRGVGKKRHVVVVKEERKPEEAETAKAEADDEKTESAE